jgi:hypothetical protein
VRTVIQYNYSHDNEGGFFLAAARGRGPAPNDAAVVRYNISQNDGANVFLLAGPVTNARIYNNTVYVREGLSTALCSEFDDGGVPVGAVYTGNIFINHGSGGFRLEVGKDQSFLANTVSGNRHPTEPPDPEICRDDPALEAPGTGTAGMDSLDGYRLSGPDATVAPGMRQPDHPERDFFGNPVPAGTPPARGACQSSAQDGR